MTDLTLFNPNTKHQEGVWFDFSLLVIGTASGASNSPVYLRDLVDITRAYDIPARYLNYITTRDKDGTWHRSRAVTLAVQMREGEQIAQFGKSVDEKLAAVRNYLPDDLIIARTSDQPLQRVL